VKSPIGKMIAVSIGYTCSGGNVNPDMTAFARIQILVNLEEE